MEHQLRFRDATPEDAGTIAAIYNESVVAGDSTMDDECKTAEDIERTMAGFNDRETYLLLEQEDGVVGWGIIKRYSDRAGYRYCCETSVYVRRNRMRRGYGSRLQEALIDRCRTYGYHHIVAKILATNEGSIRMHETFGFEIVGTQREIGYMHDQWQDVVIMQCVL
ncbi:MAG: GNAT family N-acetyltransferase [Rhodothermales bacterium]